MEKLLEIIALIRKGELKPAAKKLARLVAEMIIAMPEDMSLQARFQVNYDAMSENDLLDKVEKLVAEFGGEPTALEPKEGGESSVSEEYIAPPEKIEENPSRVIGDGTIINAFLPVLLALLKKLLGA